MSSFTSSTCGPMRQPPQVGVHQPRVPPVHGQRLPGVPGVALPPAEPGVRQGALAVGPVDHQLEQLGPAGHVGVERHRADPEVLGQTAHGQRLEPVGVGHRQRAVHHLRPARSSAAGRGGRGRADPRAARSPAAPPACPHRPGTRRWPGRRCSRVMRTPYTVPLKPGTAYGRVGSDTWYIVRKRGSGDPHRGADPLVRPRSARPSRRCAASTWTSPRASWSHSSAPTGPASPPPCAC